VLYNIQKGEKRMWNLTRVFAMVLVFGSASPVHAKLTKSGNQAAVSFTAKGTGGMSIVGKTAELVLQDDGKMLLFKVPLKNLTTGLGLRDKHLREKYLQVEKYPTAELTVDRQSLKPFTGNKMTIEIKGVMKIHGKTKTVSIHAVGQKNGQTIQVTASAQLNIQDYSIPIPSFLGISVKPDVNIAVTFEVSGT
jgi:polyisoprenoid-binding protein YceI